MTDAAAPTLRVLTTSVDWWETKYRVRVSDEARAELAKIAKACESHGMHEITIGAMVGKATAQKRPGCFRVDAGEFDAWINLGDASGWTVAIRWHALTCARSEVLDLVRRGERIALSLGTRDESSPEWQKMMRLDLAADVAGWVLGPDDATAFVGRALRAGGRGRVRRFATSEDETPASGEQEKPARVRMFTGVVGDAFERESEEEIGAQTWHSGDRVTTVAICYGAPLMLRNYDKRAELDLPQREAKRKEVEHRWRARGWDGQSPVARVEPQFRGEVLGEFRGPGGEGIEGHAYRDDNGRMRLCLCSECRERRKDPLRTARNPYVAAQLLNELWDYATRKWARMIVHDTATRRTRCATDPRWELVQGLHFTHDAIAGVRVRHRVGATVANVFGTLRSFVASRGLMPRIIAHESCYSDASEARNAAVQLVHAVFAIAFDEIRAEIERATTKEADAFAVLDRLLVQHNATIAKYNVEERDPKTRKPVPLAAPIVPAFLRERYAEHDEREAIREAV